MTQDTNGAVLAPSTVRNLGWRVTCTAWTPPVVCIVRVPTRAKAKFKAWDSANDVGYRMKFDDFRVTRAKEYDDAKLIPGRCYDEDFAQTIIPNITITDGGSRTQQKG